MRSYKRFEVQRKQRLSAREENTFRRGVMDRLPSSVGDGLAMNTSAGGTVLTLPKTPSSSFRQLVRNADVMTIPAYSIVQFRGTSDMSTKEPIVDVTSPANSGINSSIAWVKVPIEPGEIGFAEISGLMIVTVVGAEDWPGARVANKRATHVEVGYLCHAMKSCFTLAVGLAHRSRFRGKSRLNRLWRDLAVVGMAGPFVIRAVLDDIQDSDLYIQTVKQQPGFYEKPKSHNGYELVVDWNEQHLCLISPRERFFG